MPRDSAKTTYRTIHVTGLLRDCQTDSLLRNTRRFGLMRLPPVRWHQAITLLIDWDRAVNEGWPDLRLPSCTRTKIIRSIGRSHQASIRRLARNGN